MRGLKFALTTLATRYLNVAPHVGAWIEIVVTECRKYRGLVAPHVGAWIEILVAESPAVMATSHPTWVRGLKFAM